MKHVSLVRHVSRALAALGFALLVSACNSPVQPPAGKAAEERGNLVVKLAAPSERTVMPATPVFTSYVLTLQRGAEAAITVSDTSGIDGTGVSVTLSVGEWEVTLEGYRTIDGAERLAARGSETVTIAADATSQTVAIGLTPLAIGDGDEESGEFSYDFTMPQAGTLASATLTLSTTTPTVIDLLAVGASSGSVALDPGYYEMTVLLINQDGQTAGLYENVHIYSGLTSPLSYHLGNLLFANKVYIEGTLSGGRHWGTLNIWGNDQRTGDPIKTLDLTNQTVWSVDLGTQYIGDTLYAEIVDEIYGTSSSLETILVEEEGVSGVDITFDPDIGLGQNAALAYKTATASVAKAGSSGLNALDGIPPQSGI